MKDDTTSKAIAPAKRSYMQAIRKSELRRLVPLADTTIYKMEQRGEFPKRFNLSPRCVAWNLKEIEDWVEHRRAKSYSADDQVSLFPDVRLRKFRPVKS